jgi:hypothetical protein
MQRTPLARAAWCAGVVLALALATPVAPAAAEPGFLIPSAGWHGRPIQQPRPAPATPDRAQRPPRGWEAGPAALGTGTHRAAGSQRVRELQWRLKALGYRPGPIDGIFGPRTRAAVGWFQLKHGLPVDGRATFAVVRHLRDRTTPDRRATARDPEQRLGGQPTSAAPVVVTAETAGGTPLWAALGIALLAFLAGFAAVAWRQLPRAPRAPRGIGYVRVPSGDRRIDAHASAIETRCADHGIALAGLVTDDTADDRRPGLAYAFEQLEAGAADCLVVGRVGQLTRSPDELIALLDTMAGTPLVVLNADPAPPGRGRWIRRDAAGVRDG